jgi:hypothetical protein
VEASKQAPAVAEMAAPDDWSLFRKKNIWIEKNSKTFLYAFLQVYTE